MDFSELKLVHKLQQIEHPLIRSYQLAEINTDKGNYPISAFVIGNPDPSLPTLGVFGGVHGLEKIGSRVVIAFLENFFKQLSWDKKLAERLQHFRVVSIPIINPAGMSQHTRCNANGVDLMRNAPVESSEANWPLVPGHRISPKLPYYRGPVGAPMQTEAQTVIDFLQQECFPSNVLMSVDIHSGYGLHDSLWYPYAKTRKQFPFYPQANAVKKLLDDTLPYHIYKITPQSQHYLTHGDLWDYCVDEYCKLHHADAGVYIPWTLEIGTWRWLRKSPWRMFSALGLFNPHKPHRLERVMRRHLLLLHLFRRAVQNPEAWARR